MIKQELLQKDFPQRRDGSHYLDTAASSLTPLPVLAAMDEYYRNQRANIHRGLYKESVAATLLYENARKKVAAFIGANPGEMVFTSGSTGSSNMLIRMLEESLEWNSNDKVLTTLMEHHGTLVPLQQFAKRRGLTLTYVDPETHADYTNTKLASIMLVSNVLGKKLPVKTIAGKVHDAGGILICDATAAVGHMKVNVFDLGVDALWFSGHKMLGPTGIGVLWIKKELQERLQPSVFGGDMVERVSAEGATWSEAPQKFEAGTPNIAGAIGLGAAVEYLEQLGIEEVEKHSATLAFKAHRALEQIPGVRVISPCDPTQNIGIVSFVVDGVHAHDVGQILADSGVAVRSGHHCAMPLHKSLGLSATTRASFYLYNIDEDIAALVDGVKKAIAVFSK